MVDLCRLAEQAGMLHDVGKVCIRATGEKRNHSILGAELIRSFLPDSEKGRQLERCIRYHHGRALGSAHLPKEDLAYIIYEADNIAAGTDRRDKEEDSSAGFNPHVCLENIFNIFGGKGISSSFSLRPLDGEHFANYPGNGEHLEATSGMYARILEILKQNFQKKDPLSMEPDELLRILEDTLIAVPSSTNREEISDISLYDHVKITAAAAGAMVRYFQDRGITDFHSVCAGARQKEFRAAPVFLLVSADFSGIQNFIYHIPSKGAMRMLRGRSFYLDILLENLADDLLQSLGLCRANLIYSGGGHFYLLTDNTEPAKEQLRMGFEEINRRLLDFFSVSLYVAGAWEEVSPNELMGKDIREENVFQRVSRKIAESKQRRYSADLLSQLFSEDSAYNRPASGHRECSLCHRSVDKLEPYEAWRDGDEGEPPQVCDICSGLYHLGKDLIQQNSLFAVLSGPHPGCVPLPGAGGSRWLQSVNPGDVENLRKAGILLRLYEKNQSRTSGLMTARVWTADYAARSSGGKVLEFSELADNAGEGAEGKGIRRLGVLRGDVDNLGAAFMAGFRKEGEYPDRYATLSRYAALSRGLSVFFKRIITEVGEKNLPPGQEPFYIFQSKENQKRKIHVVYSGGDDFFLVGAWDDLLEFAVDLRRVFQVYTNGKLSFSAGLGLFSASYPVSRMAAEAGILEEAAKNLDQVRGKQNQKDKIALFGLYSGLDENLAEKKKQNHSRDPIYRWTELVHEVIGEKLKFLIQNMVLTGINETAPGAQQKISAGKSLLYRLMNILTETEAYRFNLAHFAYTVARMEPADKEKKDSYQNLRKQLYEWALSADDRKQLLTALQLLVYRMRDK